MDGSRYAKRCRIHSPLTMTACPFCTQTFEPSAGSAPVNSVGEDLRNHIREAHPVQDRDLKTTRWQKGAYVRCDEELSRHRLLRQRRQPPAGHGLAQIQPVDGARESEHEGVLITCKCGWRSFSAFGEGDAWHQLRIHFRNDYRLVCPHCELRVEDQDRDHSERALAQHIGIEHADRFPWGYS